jgi:hypothetical protein
MGVEFDLNFGEEGEDVGWEKGGFDGFVLDRMNRLESEDAGYMQS